MSEKLVNLERVTVQDCIENKVRKGKDTLIKDGLVVDFVYPEDVENESEYCEYRKQVNERFR